MTTTEKPAAVRYAEKLRESADLFDAGVFGDAHPSGAILDLFLPRTSRAANVAAARHAVTELGGMWRREVTDAYVRIIGRTPGTGQPVILWISARTEPDGINLLDDDLIVPAAQRAERWDVAAGGSSADRPIDFTGAAR